jgi:membrane-associated protease RseP (regulator of RpoE activity)
MEQNYEMDSLDALVRRVFRIEDITLGNPRAVAPIPLRGRPTTGEQVPAYIVRYRGRLINEDSEQAYDYLYEQLKPKDITPLFRWDGSQQAIILVPGLPAPTPSNPMWNLVLAILTILSVILTGALISINSIPSDPVQAIAIIFTNGWPFALSLMGILAAHEFGHYLAGRYHGVHVTLPYFIPFPFSQIGTLGAFINMKELPRNRKILLDIGVAGPLGGMIVAIPVLLYGLSISRLDPLPAIRTATSLVQLEGNSIAYLLAKLAIFGQLLPAPASYAGMSPLLYWLGFFFTGYPKPLGGLDVNISPVAWAGWIGLLVTAMNLIPAGQLDGGHMMYVLLGRKAAGRTFPFVLGALVLLGLVWNGWWLWAALIFFLGRRYAEPLDQITPLDTPRKLLAILALILFLVTFSPVPLSLL